MKAAELKALIDREVGPDGEVGYLMVDDLRPGRVSVTVIPRRRPEPAGKARGRP